MGPSYLSMLVFGVRIHGFLSTRCIYFPGLFLAAGSTLGLSFLGMESLPWCSCLYRLEVGLAIQVSAPNEDLVQ